jgi:RNA polymerase sigma-70 factor, ECF subfamily
MVGDPDVQLLKSIAAGDERAVRNLVVAKLPRVLALSVRLLGDRGEAEDVAQEAFLRVWRQAAAWQPGQARLDTWLHTVVLNLCRDRLRRRRDAVTDRLPEPIDPAPLPDEALGEAEKRDEVATAIAALPERQREAIVLVHYQDMTNIEAAAALKVSVDALESLLARGRRALRETLGTRET